MKNIFLLCLLMAPMWMAAQQIDTKLLQGQWVLSDIQSTDSIWVGISPDVQTPSTSKDKVAGDQYLQKKISIVEYMQKDLTCGVTRFVFQGGTFQFYRAAELTFGGNLKVKGKKMLLEYNNGNSTKENTIVSLTAEKLVLSSESKEKPVLLTFVKK